MVVNHALLIDGDEWWFKIGGPWWTNQPDSWWFMIKVMMTVGWWLVMLNIAHVRFFFELGTQKMDSLLLWMVSIVWFRDTPILRNHYVIMLQPWLIHLAQAAWSKKISDHSWMFIQEFHCPQMSIWGCLAYPSLIDIAPFCRSKSADAAGDSKRASAVTTGVALWYGGSFRAEKYAEDARCQPWRCRSHHQEWFWRILRSHPPSLTTWRCPSPFNSSEQHHVVAVFPADTTPANSDLEFSSDFWFHLSSSCKRVHAVAWCGLGDARICTHTQLFETFCWAR